MCPPRAVCPMQGEETMALHYDDEIYGGLLESERQDDSCPVEKGRSGKCVGLGCMM